MSRRATGSKCQNNHIMLNSTPNAHRVQDPAVLYCQEQIFKTVDTLFCSFDITRIAELFNNAAYYLTSPDAYNDMRNDEGNCAFSSFPKDFLELLSLLTSQYATYADVSAEMRRKGVV